MINYILIMLIVAKDCIIYTLLYNIKMSIERFQDELPFPNEQLLDLCEQFEALPLSNAFHKVLDKYLIDQKLIYRSDRLIHLEDGTLTESLSGTFFFPHSTTLSNIELSLISDATDNWSMNGSFDVGGQTYSMVASEGVSTLCGEDSNGNTLVAHTDNKRLLTLFAHIVASENDTNPKPIVDKLKDTSPKDGFKNLLFSLGSLNGRATLTRTAVLPYEHGDRAILAVVSEQESPRASGINTKFLLNWELFDANTEIIAHLNEIHNSGLDYSQLSVRYAERRSTAVSIDEYLLSQQIPELYQVDTNLQPPTQIDPKIDKRAWIHATATLMSTIGPSLDEFRSLDES